MNQNDPQDDLGSCDDHFEEEVSGVESKQPIKSMMPPAFQKAKRNVTTMINTYFLRLRDVVKAGATLHLHPEKMQDIQIAITNYVGMRFNQKKVGLNLKKVSDNLKAKENKLGLISFLSESQKIICYSNTGKINVIQLQKENFKLPDIVTPVVFEKNIYLLDPVMYNQKSKNFQPQGPAFCISNDGKMKEIPDPLFFRTRCGVAKKGEEVFLIGGEATQKKIITNRCQKYNLKTLTSQEIPPMKHKHRTPSACFQGNCLWVFSMFQVEMFNGKEWTDIGIPFGGRFLPFQYTIPINDEEILIFGGVNKNQKSRQVKIYNTKYKNVNFFGDLLPQGMSVERNSGAEVVHGCVAALSSIQASVYPQVGVISNMTGVVYLFEDSAFLNSIITL